MSYHNKPRRWALLFTAAAVAAAVACGDRATAPLQRDKSAASDFVAAGMMYNVLSVPTAAGLRAVRSSVTLLELTGTKGAVRASLGEVTPNADPGTVTVLGGQSPAFLFSGATSEQSVAKVVLKARRLPSHTVDGKRIALSVVPDDDKGSRRPPKAMLVLVNDRIAAITEYKYTHKAGAWRVARSRTTFLHEDGTMSFVMDNDLSNLVYRPGPRTSASTEWLRGTAARLGAGFLSAIQPDALFAAVPSAEEERCGTEILAAIGFNAAFVAAGLAIPAAEAAKNAAATALAAAITACAVGTGPCSAVPIAAAALAAAELGVEKAWALLVAAAAAAAAADAALSHCLYPPDRTETGPSGESESDCEEWCQWTITFTDGRMNVRRDYCWCESPEDEL